MMNEPLHDDPTADTSNLTCQDLASLGIAEGDALYSAEPAAVDDCGGLSADATQAIRDFNLSVRNDIKAWERWRSGATWSAPLRAEEIQPNTDLMESFRVFNKKALTSRLAPWRS